MFQFGGGLGVLFGGLSPPKPPVATGLFLKWCQVSFHIVMAQLTI